MPGFCMPGYKYVMICSGVLCLLLLYLDCAALITTSNNAIPTFLAESKTSKYSETCISDHLYWKTTFVLEFVILYTDDCVVFQCRKGLKMLFVLSKIHMPHSLCIVFSSYNMDARGVLVMQSLSLVYHLLLLLSYLVLLYLLHLLSLL